MFQKLNTKIFITITAGFFSSYLTGCAVQDTTATNTTTGTDATPTPTVTATPTPTPGTGASAIDTSVTEFAVTVQSNPNYTSAISKWTSATLVGGVDGVTKCTATAGDDLLCIVDMNELDLYFRGYTLVDTEPSSLCSYRRFLPYYYAVAPVGNAPTKITYTLDSTSGIVANTSGLGGGTADIYYLINGTWRTHTQIYGTAAKKDTDALCPFDYSNSVRAAISKRGKNCCYGNYSKTVKDSTGTVTTTSADWGGSRGNCFQGPAMDNSNFKFFEDGAPDTIITNIDSSVAGGLSTAVTVAAPIVTGPGGTTTAKNKLQTYAVNYFQIAHHGSDVPSATRVARAYFDDQDVNSSAYFLYDCLDQNEDVVARIRVLIRRWSTNAEFLKFLASKGLTGNPDLGGLETRPTQIDPDPTTGLGNNIDRCVWDDYASGGFCAGAAPAYNSSSNYFGFASSSLTAAQIGAYYDDSTFTYTGF